MALELARARAVARVVMRAVARAVVRVVTRAVAVVPKRIILHIPPQNTNNHNQNLLLKKSEF